MKLESAALDIETSGFGSKSQFTIAASPQAFDILTSNIYENKIRAVVREISCNAYDAHVAAGVTKPFEVHLPTAFEPWFSVRDFGRGLSPEELAEVYTTFFRSTKSDSNEYVGAFGLGSKSPFCLVESFTVISYFDGIKSTYCCYRDTDRSLQISLVNQSSCGEETGLEVIVEGQDGDYKGASFRQEAIEVFSYFNRIPSINIPEVSAEIQRRISSFTVLRDGFVADFSKKVEYNACVAVMGNVSYRIPYDWRFKFPIRVYFNIGDLSVNPGRESLSLDSKTKSILEVKLKEVQSVIPSVYIEELLKIQNDWDKLSFYESTYPVLMHFLSESQKKEVKDLLPLPVKAMCYTLKGKRPVKSYETVTTMNNGHGRPPVHFHSKPKIGGKICAYVKANKCNVYLLTEDDIKSLSIPRELVKDATVLPSPTRSYGTRDKFDFYVYDGNHFNKECIDEDFCREEIVYVRMDRGAPMLSCNFIDLVESYCSKRQIVFPRIYGFNDSMIKKFGGKLFRNWVVENIQVPEKVPVFECYNELYTRNLFLNLASHPWSNPKIADLLNSFKESMDLVSSASDIACILSSVGISYEKDSSATTIYKSIIDKFPLLPIISSASILDARNVIHIKSYMEAVYG